MKYIFFISFFLINEAVYSQLNVSIEWRSDVSNRKGDTIFYDPATKLIWDDFKGKPDHKSVAAAITSSGFGYTMTMNAKNGKMQIGISVYCFYNRSSSWVKPGMASAYALIHEQHHFDITYIGTCLFIKKLRAAAFTWQNYASLVDKIYKECHEEMEKMQNDYDGQTKNGQLKNIQTQWNMKVDQYLSEITIN